MDLFTYLLARDGKKSLVHGDLFSYLLGKSKEGKIDTVSGVNIYIENAKSKKIVSLIMDKESTQDGTPTPENPIEVTTVKGYRNLYDGEYEIGVYSTTTGNKAPGSNTYRNTNFISVIPNETYKFYINNVDINYNVRYFFYDINKNFISTSISQSQFTVPNNCYYVNWHSSAMYTNNPDGLLKPMILEGTEVKPYVPYGNNYISFNVSDGNTTIQTPIPLNNNEIVGLGDYKDELIVDENGHCWLNKKTGKKILDGSETYNYISSNHRFTLLEDIGMLDLNTTKYPKIGILSNEYIEYGTRETFDYGITRSNATTTYNYEKLVISNKDYSSANAFKQALSQNNVTIYYPLKNPTKIDLNTTVNLKLFNGVNNITNSANCNMVLEYYKNV